MSQQLLRRLLVFLVVLVANLAYGEASQSQDRDADSVLYRTPPTTTTTTTTKTTPKIVLITLLLIPIVSLLVWIFHTNKNDLVLFYNTCKKQISRGINGSSSSSSSAKVNGIIGEERVDTETEKVKNQGDDDDDDREEEDSVDNDDRKEEYYDDDDERIEEHNYQGDDKEISFQEYDVVFAVDGSLLANCHTTGNQLFRKLVESSTGIHNNAPPTPQRRSRRNRSVDPTQKALVDNNLKEFYDAVSDNDGRFLRQHFNARDGTHSESYREMIDNEALNVISVSIAVGSCDEPIALG